MKKSGTNSGKSKQINSNKSSNANGKGHHRNSKVSIVSQEISAANLFQKTSLQHEKRRKEVLQSFEDIYQSSSDEDNLDDDGILNNITKSYQNVGNHTFDNGDLGATAQYLTESCQSGAISCLICISRIKRPDKIWSCVKCYGIFHLNCIKQWVTEGVTKATILSDELFPKRDLPWYCPKCRYEYSRSDCPEYYFCYCGAVKDPPVDPWLIPHSCGKICNKKIADSNCDHHCLLLCHPGPCPPCPQMVQASCFCCKKPPVSRRCGSSAWSCGQVCGKWLKCKRHKCQEVCHAGDCPPCKQKCTQPCKCGLQSRIQSCISPEWSCKKPCGKLLSCGYHYCEKVCHKRGDCGDCPRSGLRTCPCGKQKYEDLICKDNVQTCGDTCGKALGCYGNHKCSRPCHFGDCGPCTLVVRKHCRCKRTKREAPCYKEFSCDSRCYKTKPCGKHQCKRKCCVGPCPPCEQLCNKVLQCKRHKCQMLCHSGPCYPCSLTSRVTCNCGKTGVTIICGKQNKIKPPRCRRPCAIPSNCHHTNRVPHLCHFGSCPDCNQICSKKMPCGHLCTSLCHDNVVIKHEFKPTAPWEKPQKLVEVKAIDCPPCKAPVTIICMGKHESAQFACYEAKDYSCGRKCGRKLSCENHTCSFMCHVVNNATSDTTAGTNCEVCERPCPKPRHPDCKHKCISLCHPGDCAPCRKPITMKCHCGIVVLKYLCCEWCEKLDSEKDQMMSCGNNCWKKLSPCGHSCSFNCHSGPCSPSTECQHKVYLRCPCKRKKQEFVCSIIQIKNFKVDCDKKCQEIKTIKDKEKSAKDQKKKDEENERQQSELKKYENWLERKPKRGRKRHSVSKDKPESLWSRLTNSVPHYVTFVFGSAILLGACYYLLL